MMINILILINPNIFKSFHELIHLKSDPKPAPHIDTQLATIWGTYTKGQIHQLSIRRAKNLVL